MTFGETIRTKREALGLTCEFVSSVVGCSKGYISGIETGKVAPPLTHHTKKLSAVLALDPDTMIALAFAEKAPEEVREKFIEFALTGFKAQGQEGESRDTTGDHHLPGVADQESPERPDALGSEEPGEYPSNTDA